MNTFLVTYELKYGDSSYAAMNLIRKLRSFKIWAHPLNNVWLIKTESEKNAVYNFLIPSFTTSDRILIMKVNDEWIAYNLSTNVIDWMKGGL